MPANVSPEKTEDPRYPHHYLTPKNEKVTNSESRVTCIFPRVSVSTTKCWVWALSSAHRGLDSYQKLLHTHVLQTVLKPDTKCIFQILIIYRIFVVILVTVCSFSLCDSKKSGVISFFSKYKLHVWSYVFLSVRKRFS